MTPSTFERTRQATRYSTVAIVRHKLLALALMALAGLHIAAALKHHLLDRDGLLLRMLPKFA